jgi:glutathione synthase
MGKPTKLRIGVIMDPIEDIKVYKDSSFAMLLAAQKRGWELRTEHWFDLEAAENIELASLDAVLMRKDPPFDMEYINTTYLLDLAERAGCLIVNRPQSLRDANEKMFITQFPQCCTPMLVSRQAKRLREFVAEQGDVILKPLDGMGGMSIFRVRPDDVNLSVILETISQNGSKTVMAQRFIPEISAGDKRILMIDGEAVPFALARIPAKGETRGNLAAGGQAAGRELSERDHWICQQVGPVLREMGILFAGIDVIGDYLTEINITSPTCIRELDSIYKLDIASQLMDAIAARCQA